MKPIKLVVGLVTSILCSCDNTVTPPAGIGKWTTTYPMATARAGHSATVLPSGEVLVVGGFDASWADLASAEIYDPAAATWRAAQPMPGPRRGHSAVLLPSGVLVVGGGHHDGTGWVPDASAVLYDPALDKWAKVGSMATARWWPTAVRLPSGQVLAAGGEPGADGAGTETADLYDPVARRWTKTGSMSMARCLHAAALLPSGKVLVAGGLPAEAGSSTETAELYDPSTAKWSKASPMPWSAALHTATVLPSGEVLVAGGALMSPGTHRSLKGASVLGTDGTWSPTASMSRAHSEHVAVLLHSGEVLVIAGEDPGAGVEIYDPATKTWQDAVPTSVDHGVGAAAVVLADGKVLLTGGLPAGMTPRSYGAAIRTAELFSE